MHSAGRKVFSALAAMSAVAVAPLAPTSSQGPARAPGARGCNYYADAGYRGARAEIVEGEEVRSLGETLNDKISTITCHSACTLTIFEHPEYGGIKRRITGDVPSIGDAWNDKISSMTMSCRRKIRGTG